MTEKDIYILKKGIKIIGLAIIGGVALFKAGDTYAETCCTLGLNKAHENGIIRFFDGEKECGPEKAAEILKELG